MQRRDLVPSLRRTHPNFFLNYFVVAMLHLYLGFAQLITPERFAIPVNDWVFARIPIRVWGWTSLVVWAFATIGVYLCFDLARLALLIGFVSTLGRGFMLELAPRPSGAGLAVWGFIAAVHLSMLREPQINPLTSKDG